MALPEWEEDSSLGKAPCIKERDTWKCPNMKSYSGADCGRFEYFKCLLCDKLITIDWDECK